jgi:hypothetical protein
MTTFALGGTYNTTTLKSDTKSERQEEQLDYLAVGLLSVNLESVWINPLFFCGV